MKSLKIVYFENKFFIIPYLVILLVCCFFLFTMSKFDLHVWSNIHNNSICDSFFKYATWLGDGVFVIIVGVLFLFRNIKSAILIVGSYIATGIPVQLLKRLFFAGTPRPKLFFEGKYSLHFVEGVDVHSINSFPSGHSASAFALFLCLCIVLKHKTLQPLFLIIACLVAYSRVYLSQHFAVDAIVGSFIGVFTVFVCYYFIGKYQKPWMEKSISELAN